MNTFVHLLIIFTISIPPLQLPVTSLKLRRYLLVVRAEAAKSDFLCQHETLETTLLHLPTAQKSFILSN